MFDIWLGDIELTTLTLLVSVAVLLPVQSPLCFKVRSLRLAPVLLLSALTACFVGLWLSTPGWKGLGYAFFAIFAGFMGFMCGVGWGLWAVVSAWRKRGPARRQADGTIPAVTGESGL